MQLDWRPLLPRITIPCLNVAGRKSQIFPWEGVEVVGKLIPNCHTVRGGRVAETQWLQVVSAADEVHCLANHIVGAYSQLLSTAAVVVHTASLTGAGPCRQHAL